MINARSAFRHYVFKCRRQVHGVGWGADLVVDHAQFASRLGFFQDGAHKVLAARPEQPGGARDPEARHELADKLLALQLAPSVDAQGIGGVVFHVGRRFLAVEDIIRADMEHWNAGVAASQGQVARPLCVHTKS